MTGLPPAALSASRPPLRARASAYLKAVAAILGKDLAAEWRSKEMFSAMLVFSILVVMIFSFALELDRGARENVVGAGSPRRTSVSRTWIQRAQSPS